MSTISLVLNYRRIRFRPRLQNPLRKSKMTLRFRITAHGVLNRLRTLFDRKKAIVR